MTEMVKMQEKHSQNNIAKEISEGKTSTVHQAIFQTLESLIELSRRKRLEGVGVVWSHQQIRNQKQLVFTEDNTFGPISAL